MEMEDLFQRDENLGLFIERFKKEFRIGLEIDKNQAGTSGAGHGKDDGGDGVDALDMDIGNGSSGGDNNVEGEKENEQVKTSEEEEPGMKDVEEKSAKEAAKKAEKKLLKY
ncbi:hypothetical protein Tco_0191993 [Tanacetum coccineum]